jgi:hypothetical protein
MKSDESKIHLIHERRTILLNRMFEELTRRPGACAEKVSDEVISTARAIQDALSVSGAIGTPARGLFVLALQQVADSLLAGLLTDEAFVWLERERLRPD